MTDRYPCSRARATCVSVAWFQLMRAHHSSSWLEHSSQLFLCCVIPLACVRSSAPIAFSLCLSPSYPPRKAKVKERPIAASARLYCGGQLLQATLSGPCSACLVSHPWQLVPYAALGLGRDGANKLALSRLELRAHSGLDNTTTVWKI